MTFIQIVLSIVGIALAIWLAAIIIGIAIILCEFVVDAFACFVDDLHFKWMKRKSDKRKP